MYSFALRNQSKILLKKFCNVKDFLFFKAKVQLQIVAQLEHSLLRERERLNAMMAHLNKVSFVPKTLQKCLIFENIFEFLR